MFTIKVPASTANMGNIVLIIGPGFDSLGAALSVYLTIIAKLQPGTDKITISYSGSNADSVPLDPQQNLITKVAIYVANAYKLRLPGMSLLIENPIPLGMYNDKPGRGMGSSGSAVVAGVSLAKEALNLNLSKQQMLDFSTLMEGHPDNVAPSLLGGLITSYIRTPIEEPMESCFIPGNAAIVPDALTQSTPLNLNPKIKVVVVVPDFQVKTALARSVLPESYTRADVVFNLSRLASLTHALTSESINACVISETMQDAVHQPYRQTLVPGLKEILQLDYRNINGLLGVCLSGAGPSILALAQDSFQEIGERIVGIFASNLVDGKAIQSEYMVLEFDKEGLVVTRNL